MKKILFISFIISCIGTINAQHFQLHTGIVYPTGDFASDDVRNDYAGNATTGFNIGIKSYLPLSHSNLSFVFGFDFFYNELTSKYEDSLNPTTEIDGYSGSSYPKYLNMPLTLGLNYSYPLYKELKVYGEAGLGINCSMMTSNVIKYGENEFYGSYLDNYEDKIVYANSYGLCYNAEGGFLIKWFRLGLKYNYLGSHNYKTKWVLTENGDEIDSEKWENTKRIISNWQLMIGFVF